MGQRGWVCRAYNRGKASQLIGGLDDLHGESLTLGQTLATTPTPTPKGYAVWGIFIR